MSGHAAGASASRPSTADTPGGGPGSGAEGGPTVDVRVQRTRARLREAVLRLATEQPVEDISVADLVRAARVNRTTFYKHADSPAAVLAQVLYEDLDQVRSKWIDDTLTSGLPAHEVWERASTALIGHLGRHDALYTVGLVGRRSPVLHRLLVDHFIASVRTLLERQPEMLPAAPSDQGDTGAAAPGAYGPVDWRIDAYSRFVAHGEVGLVEA
ncbi:TetR/AcrR family transcriptional regulator, partial [Streptomyces longispororuber]|uniref:TetR/AcrR family transcriptional regulator n=1 Tax=Streptomyces longispororuber TaxID=68230 RepID=UPI00210BCDDB